MAEAILSVLKEGLSLSQAARKYDIPYPTFVLYANRVHNMLGPSVDGGSGKYLQRLYEIPALYVCCSSDLVWDDDDKGGGRNIRWERFLA